LFGFVLIEENTEYLTIMVIRGRKSRGFLGFTRGSYVCLMRVTWRSSKVETIRFIHKYKIYTFECVGLFFYLERRTRSCCL